MNSKTQLLFAMSIAAILSVSLITAGGIQQATADDDRHDDNRELKFDKKPAFKADCDQINTGLETDWECKALFWLDKKGENLKYKIKIDNMDLTGWQTVSTTLDDVGKVHLHNEELNNAHVLNVWKAPIEDDEQMKAVPSKGVLKGIYDDSDITSEQDAQDGNIGHHDTSKPLTENLDGLCNGSFFVMIHEAAGPGVLKGFLEPTKQENKICEKLR